MKKMVSGMACGLRLASGLAYALLLWLGMGFSSRLPAAQWQQLSGHVPSVVAHLRPSGYFPGTNNLRLAIGLPLRNQSDLTNLLAQIYNPASTNYHRFLTSEQFTERFGPASGDYQSLIAFARSNGLQVTGVHSNRTLLDVSGPANQIERVLHVKFQTYQHPTEGRNFYAPDVEPSLDAPVRVLHISGLSDYSLPHPMCLKKNSLGRQSLVTPLAGSGPSGTFLGNDFRKAYAPGTSLTGLGQQVGLLEFDNSGFYQSDITNYEGRAGLPYVPVTAVLLNDYDGTPGAANDECSLDIELTIAMAPGLSQVLVYEGSMPNDILNRMATDNQAKQLSSSWGFPIDATTEQIYQQFAVQGQSYFNASGDSDAWVGGVSTPSDDPYITVVGGTTLTTAADGSWSSETVWNWGGGIGSGGGISTKYAIPSWQQGVNMTLNLGSTTMRNIPDVALTADNIYVVYNNGSSSSYGGTSCATPLWAAFMALINQQATNNGLPPMGFINPMVYALGNGLNYTSLFHDVSTGNNISSASPNLFYAVPGYDLCTGWGTPAGQNLIDALAGPTTPTPPFITAQPKSQTNASGTTVIMDVIAGGSAPLIYQWIFNGTNLPNATKPSLLLPNVQPNQTGIYNVLVTNMFGFALSSNAVLTVITEPPVILTQPVDQTANIGYPVSFMISAGGSLPLGYQWKFNGANLDGATNAVLFLANVGPGQAGNYSVVVTNLYGSVISSNALLTVNLAPPCVTAPSGLVSWWPGEGASVDVLGTNNGMLEGPITFASGEVGRGFWYYNDGADVRIPASASLDVGPGGGFTIEAWINCTNVTKLNPIFEWNKGDGVTSEGVHLYVWTDGSLYGNVVDTGGSAFTHSFSTAPGLITSNGFFHVALTYDHNSGTGTIYCNGAKVAQQVLGKFIPLTSFDLYIGRRPPTLGETYSFAGILDEPSLYSRALTGNEIQAIYQAGAGGKCQPLNPPVIIIQPADQTVAVGSNAIFSVTVTGGLPLTYQWFFGGDIITNGTSSNLILTNVQLNEAGLYSVVVSNVFGSTSSSNALLAVLALPPTIEIQPVDESVYVGQNAMFGVFASGSPPLYYQWYCNGTNILGETNASLTLLNVQFDQAGVYTVLVTNAFGSDVSSGSVLTVNTVPDCTNAPPGLVSWWPGQGDATDVVGTNNGVLEGGISFNNGEVGQAFGYYQTNADVRIPASASLNVGSVNGFTLEAWILCTDISHNNPIFEWNKGDGATWEGVHLYCLAGGSLYGNVVDNGGDVFAHAFSSAAGLITNNGLYHVALTYDKTTGLESMYCNGIKVAEQNIGRVTPLTSYDLYLGRRPPTLGETYTFSGLIDEPSLYIRALTSAELLAVFNAGSGGKCISVSPAIVSQPANLTVLAGTNVVFQVTAAGSRQLTYQWFFNQTNLIDGATNTSLALTNVQTISAGYYSVVVTNPYGSVASSNALLSVIALPPVILTQPTNQTTFVGLSASFSVVATGNPTLRYQWEFQGTNLPGATNSVLTLVNLQPIQSGVYSVLITNAFGSALSSNATLTVIALPPTITTQPTNRAVNVSSNASFRVAASGTSPLGYQWMFQGTNLIGATNAVLNLTNVQLNQAGIYTVLVSNPFGAILSSNATLTVIALPPTILTQPSNQLVYVGFTAGFSIVASGSPYLVYQWRFQGTNLFGATNSSLTLTNVQLSQAGQYSVFVTNVYGSILSTNALLTVNPVLSCAAPPTGLVSWWPGESNNVDIFGTNNGVLEGGLLFTNGEVGQAFYFNNTNADFKIPASGSLNVGTNNVGFTIETWIRCANVNKLNPIFEWNTGDGTAYGVHFYCWSDGGLYVNVFDKNGSAHIFQSSGGLIASNVLYHVALTFNKATGVAAVFRNGVQVMQSTVGTITPMTAYSLYFGKRPLTRGETYSFTGTLDEPSLYNRALSASELLAIYNVGAGGKCLPFAAPVITSQPTNQAVALGVNATFKVSATGSFPIGYQWFFNGTGSVTGATNATLILTNVQKSQAGAYSVLVTNAFGYTTSSNALLSLLLPPVITNQPVGLNLKAGSTATFTVAASGTAPLNYQWYWNTTNNPALGATNANFSVSNIQPASAGSYFAIVTNLYGMAVSSNAWLIVHLQDHFAWGVIPSPRFANTPFTITIQAQNATNGITTDFNGSVNLTSTQGIPVFPSVSGNFVQGVWTGAVMVAQTISNFVLKADDGLGETGLANAINIVNVPPLGSVRTGANLLMFWPSGVAGFVMETSSNLSSSNWVPVGSSPILIGSQYLMSFPMSDTNRFYRLRYTIP